MKPETLPTELCSLPDSFWKRVEFFEDCWIWTGPASRKTGYGLYKHKRVHRVIWTLIYGPIPKWTLIRHFICHTKLCINPTHLASGTHQDNSNDMVRAGRSLRGRKCPYTSKPGELNGQSKLTWNQVREIRRLKRQGVTQKEISKHFPVSFQMISRICRRKAWINET